MCRGFEEADGAAVLEGSKDAVVIEELKTKCRLVLSSIGQAERVYNFGEKRTVVRFEAQRLPGDRTLSNVDALP